MKKKSLFNDFFNSEKAGGLILVFATAISLLLTNSVWGESYLSIWNTQIAQHSITHWVNDGLMAIFFLLIGLELEREIYQGELSSFKKAGVPFFGALGGMLLPALIYLAFNLGKITQSGAGIPMATDIAFAIGILSLLGNKVPVALKIFLTALAVIDDLGAILVIAIFYTNTINLLYLGLALTTMGVLFIFNRKKVNNLIPYLIGGAFMWYCMLNSGIHATITGILLAFVIPFGDGSKASISYKLQHQLHRPVAYFILPIFALANTCILIPTSWENGLLEPNSIGIIIGLLLGKPLGILLFSMLGVALGLCVLPKGLNWKIIFGAGILGGIGFTMSIFITLLAFDDEPIILTSKIAILTASLFASIIGYFTLKTFLKK